MNHHLLFSSTQLAVLAIGLLVPAIGYVLNHYAPWVDEKTKGVIQVVIAAVSAALYQAVNSGSFGFNNVTLQLVITAVIASLSAHHLFWKPSGISTTLGGGSNAPQNKA